MPFTIDEERFLKQETLDMTRPQGTPQGLPVKQIPHHDYPRVMYKHPNEPFRTIVHRNTRHEVVEEETVPAEALTCTVRSEHEMKQKIKEGWTATPYVQQAPPDPNAHLYEAAK